MFIFLVITCKYQKNEQLQYPYIILLEKFWKFWVLVDLDHVCQKKFTFSSKNDKSQMFAKKMLIFVHFYWLLKMSPTFS